MTLEEFLAARLAETWAVARDRELAAGLDESLATRAVDAGRAILATHEHADAPLPGMAWLPCRTCKAGEATVWPAAWPCATLRHLAAIWSDHPDYDEVWRP